MLISAVLGWRFCEANQAGAARARPLLPGSWPPPASCASLAFVAYDTWMHTPVRFGFMRDFIVNRHWTPRGVTLFWVGAVLFCSTPVAWYLMDRPGVGAALAGRAGADGDDALLRPPDHRLHHREAWLGVAFHSWLGYWVANVVLMVLLLYIGKAWLMDPAAPPAPSLAPTANWPALRREIARPLTPAAPPASTSMAHWEDPARVRHSSEVRAMTWEAPDFIEIKMDAEINSYQDDFEREQDDRF